MIKQVEYGHDALKTKKDLKGNWEYRLYAGYSLLFGVLAVLVFSIFLRNGKGFIWDTDGWEQHYVALMYIGEWMRDILKKLIVNHVCEIPVWDFSLGQGADILTTFQYYGLGDPLAMLVAFVPVEKIEYFYCILIVFRMYLAGLFFLFFCRYMGREQSASILGALNYAFCSYALFASVRHPFFQIPVMYFPLLTLGAEKIFCRENPAIFIVTLALTTISNFYFAYMQCILIIMYVCIRYFSIKEIKHCKELPVFLARFLVAGLVGLAIAAVLLLPVVNCFIQNGRIQAENEISMFYQRSYYEQFLTGLLGQKPLSGYTMLGVNPVSMMCVILLFANKKENLSFKVLFAAMLVMFMFPVFGHIMNGFSYVSNRWSWAFAFVVCYILTLMWPKLCILGTIEKRWLVICVTVSFLICSFLLPTPKAGVEEQRIVLCIALAVICFGTKVSEKITRGALALLCLVSIVLGSNALYSPDYQDYVSDFRKLGVTHRLVTETASHYAKEKMEQSKAGRFAQQGGFANESVLSGTRGIGTYWSLIGNAIPQYRREMELVDTHGYKWSGFDGRAFLAALNNAGNLLIDPEEKNYTIPYGFELSEKNEKYLLYQSMYTLPFGYTYDTVITEEAYARLTAEQRQEALMQAVLIDERTEHQYAENVYNLTSFEIPYIIKPIEGDCELGENSIYMRDIQTKLAFCFDEISDGELYLNIKGFDGRHITRSEYLLEDEVGNALFRQMDEEEKKRILREKRIENPLNLISLSITDDKIEKSFYYFTPRYQFYFGAHDFLVNMGYSSELRNMLTLTISGRGSYEFDDIRIVCQKVDSLKEYVSARREESLQNVHMSHNGLKGDISVSENKILCLTFPYSSGWKAYVDGNETRVLRANRWSTAIELEPGYHEIEFQYYTPWLKMGAYLSLMGVMAFVLIEYGYMKKKWYVS